MNATFGRGQGLGNRLFPFARAFVYSQKHGIPMLVPSFAHIRKASFMLGGIDYRKAFHKILLWDTFHFERPVYKKGLINKRRILASYKKIAEPLSLDTVISEDNVVIDFAMHHEFTPLLAYREMIGQELRNITKDKWLSWLKNIPDFPIGMNIRLGNDFRNAQSKDDFMKKGALKTPLSWFKESLELIRQIKNNPVPAFIISDGTRAQLKELLDMPNVHFIETPTAMTDLFALSRCKLLLGSGGSSFSAWASFLGKMPTLTIYGQSLDWFKLSPSLEVHYVGTLDPDKPGEAELNMINQFSL
ncbi:MAG: hypothetical protein JST58_01110 [Bacteroidetes bacterium]|nr:hypothetical protein [Bacteroidota bacterium]